MRFTYGLIGVVFLCFTFNLSTVAQRLGAFNYGKGLRVDFVLTGLDVIPSAGLISLSEEPYWSAPVEADVTDMDYGEYKVNVFDANKKILFSRGFCSLYGEWITTNQVERGPSAFEHSISIPFPEKSVEFALFVRKLGDWVEFARWKINTNTEIIKRNTFYYQPEVILVLGDSADYKNSLDLTFVADGYTIDQKENAIANAHHFAKYLIDQPPFNLYKERINCWLSFVPSQQNGVTIPNKKEYRNTILESSFSTLGLSRYLSTERYFKLRNIASATPYDFVLVMVNTDKYGGGGIFNHLAVFSANNAANDRVFVHEFGHHFGGLADEYFNSEVPYVSEGENLIEPWQPNVTKMLDFDLKWSSMVPDSVPIPTQRIAKYKDVIGVFEGGMYVSKGVYSPAIDCRMKSNDSRYFCKVCQAAIVRMLEVYIKK